MYNHEKDHKCDCARCQAIAEGASEEEASEKYRQWEEEKLAEFGWIVHFVGDDSDSPTRLNIHTHGLQENYNHPDLQIVLGIPQQVVQPILHQIVDRIKAGEKFGDGDVLEDIIADGLPIKLVSATECNRSVLRLIFPDKSGCCDSWSMKDPYLRQYGDLVELPELPEKFKPRKRSQWKPFKGK